MATHWAHDAIVYHVYPLGLTGAPARNDGHAAPADRLRGLADWLPHWRRLGATALYVGPLFESATHGYDTIDYGRVDRRLGSNADLASFVAACHAQGLRVVLDAVLNHVGRDFWAFQDVVRHGAASRYAGWFAGLRFDRRSPLGDPFTYDTWGGAYELVKLNVANPEVAAYLLDAVADWIREFAIDGLRLDAADCLDLGFLRALAARCRAIAPDFWLMGEVVFGDYTRWANGETLDATTNYEAYKGLHSSHNARNYFEIAHSLNRQFGPGGVYRGLPLYAFADNHDVNRIASELAHPPHLFPLHVLLFTMPGVPSIYYGSEWALPGRKAPGSDAPLRPALAVSAVAEHRDHPLAEAIGRLAAVRHALAPLRRGDYRQLAVGPQHLAFVREAEGECVVVAVNGDDAPVRLDFELPGRQSGWLVDALNGDARFPLHEGRVSGLELPATWGRVLRLVAH